MAPNVTYYDGNMNRLDCTSCGNNAQTLTNGRCAVCIEFPCRHAYVTSDGRCLHCNDDCSQQLAAATQALNAAIARQLAHGPHSLSTTPPNTGKGVAIAATRPAAPRHGGLEFFCTESGDEFSVGA